MCSGQREIGFVVTFKLRRPPRIYRVTFFTACRERRKFVPWILRRVVVRFVATDAERRSGLITTGVTSCAIVHGMSARQREIWRVLKARLFPSGFLESVTLQTLHRKACEHMIGLGRRFELLHVAAAAVHRQIHILTVRVACLTIEVAMQSDQREARRIVHLFKLRAINPLFGRVTPGAIVAELTVMDLDVAIQTLSFGILKDRRGMTLDASHARMSAHERKLRLRCMIKGTVFAKLRPASCRVADLTINLQIAVRILLREQKQ